MSFTFTDRASEIFHKHVSVLVRQVCGGMQEEPVTDAIEELTRLLAVSGRDASGAAGFVVEAVRCAAGASRAGASAGEFEARLARVHRLALESYQGHRARIARIREGELQRSGFVARRARERKVGTC